MNEKLPSDIGSYLHKKAILSTALSENIRRRKLKIEEKEILGDMLIEFFETEMAMDELLIKTILLEPSALETAKEKLAPFIPARQKMEFLKNHSIINDKIAGLFQFLHDERNNLAHPKGEKHRVGRRITQEIRKNFINNCKTVLTSVYQAQISLYEKNAVRLKKEMAEYEERIYRAAMSKLRETP